MVTEEGPACARQSRAREGLADSLFKTELAACGGDGPARRGTGCGEMRFLLGPEGWDGRAGDGAAR